MTTKTTRFLRTLTLSLILLIISAACIEINPLNSVKGNGNTVTRSFDIDDFSKLQFDGAGDITIRQGEAHALAITTDENLFDVLIVDSRGDTLTLGMKSNTSLSIGSDILYELTVVDLNDIQLDGATTLKAESLEAADLEIDINGASSLTIGNLSSESLDLSVSGAGTVTIAGQTETQSTTLSGTGTLNLVDLKSNSADVSIDGLGTMSVWVTSQLDANLSGAGTINYKGSPTVNKSVDGLGVIRAISGG